MVLFYISLEFINQISIISNNLVVLSKELQIIDLQFH